MKCLDEGVDIPRAETAIFCSSTGNPRQFIQRRGRVLRTHQDKEIAYIYDLIVLPAIGVNDEITNLERKLITEEFERVVYFASLSSNYYESTKEISNFGKRCGINIYELEDKLGEKVNG